MEIKNALESFFGNYRNTFYIENISVSEISISINGKEVPDVTDVLHSFLNEDEEKSVFNSKDGFVFYISNDRYVIDFDDYVTTSIFLYPKVTISKKGIGFDIKLFMKHD